MGEIADGETEGHVDAGEHDGGEEVPAGDGDDEAECTASLGEVGEVSFGDYGEDSDEGERRSWRVDYLLAFHSSTQRGRILRILVHERKIPIGTSQARKGADEREEDDDEGDVGAQGADQIDEAEQAHEDEEEAEGGVVGGRGETGGVARVATPGGDEFGVRCVGAVGVEPGDQGASQGEPEGALVGIG